MFEVDEMFKSCTHLGEELDEIKKCHEKHSEVLEIERKMKSICESNCQFIMTMYKLLLM